MSTKRNEKEKERKREKKKKRKKEKEKKRKREKEKEKEKEKNRKEKRQGRGLLIRNKTLFIRRTIITHFGQSNFMIIIYIASKNNLVFSCV